MELIDVIKIPITEEMKQEAYEDKTFFENYIGTYSSAAKKTRNASEDRDYIGSLGHQCVEKAFEWMGLSYMTLRRIRKDKGDDTDIVYGEDSIDVKSHRDNFNEKYFYNQGFLVFQKQLDNDEKMRKLTHFAFVIVDKQYQNGYVYGVIRTDLFLAEAKPVQLTWDNQEIKAYQLTPFRKYALHL